MRLVWAISSLVFCTACSPQEGQHNASPDAATCLSLDAKPDDRFGNAKECFYAACEAGDQASCDYAASYNGNMQQEISTAE